MDKLPPVAHQPPAQAAPSRLPSTVSTPPSQESREQAERMRKINRMVGRLFSAYPKNDYEDPDAALLAMVKVLSAYPLSVVNRLTNEGLSEALQLKHKFPPRLAEIKEAAEAIMSNRVKEVQLKERLTQQRAETAERMAPRGDRPTYAQLLEKYGPNFGIDPDGGARKAVEKTFRAPTVDELRAYYAEHTTESKSLTGSAGTRKGTNAHVGSERSSTPSAGATDRISEDTDCDR